jgi:hypothetical protein
MAVSFNFVRAPSSTSSLGWGQKQLNITMMSLVGVDAVENAQRRTMQPVTF